MNDPGTDLLLWAKGPGFAIALTVFVLGVILRLIEVLALRRKTDLAAKKGEARSEGWRNVWRRFLPRADMMAKQPVVHIGGYIFHIGLFIVVFLFVPHIVLIRDALGFAWPGLPNGIVDGVTLVTMVAMVAVLWARVKDPVKKHLSEFEDYVTWVVTFLPLLTGYMAVNRLLLNYDMMLALHILSVELLLIVFPFTKLMHGITWVFARYYSGAIAGRKGAHS